MPRHRPPYPVERGLDSRPTVINNVKTLATVPPIVEKRGSVVPGHRDSGEPGHGGFFRGGQCDPSGIWWRFPWG